MKFKRLRVANYRGITSADIEFGPSGITIIQGQNETGKTSLGEAIGLLFEYHDSSKHRNIEAVKPVHRDEGPEIELQAESGPYSFSYFKRFLKRPETRLNITNPRPENRTGREAHERAEAILRETLDIDLWKALNIQQGDAIGQPNLKRQTSLSTALDKAAGGHPTDPREEGLFDKVREEYLRYFTERGTEKKELNEARKLQAEAEIEVTNFEKALVDLDHDIERVVTLQRELVLLKKQEGKLTEELTEYTNLLENIDDLENTLSEARLRLETAQKSEQVALRDIEIRQGLIDAVDKSTKAHSELVGSGEISLMALNQANAELTAAQSTYEKSDLNRRITDSLVFLCRADCDYFNDKLHLEQLRERKDRIDTARKNSARAEGILASNKVDNKMLESIQGAERGLLTAEAQMQVGAPNVLLHGLGDCRLKIDDSEVKLSKGEEQKLSIAEKARLIIPGMLDINITAGAGAEALAKKLEVAQRDLDDACTKAGVSSPNDARTAFENSREALQLVQTNKQIEKESLRDLTYDKLAERLLNLEESVPNYLSNRVTEPRICSDLETAKKELIRVEGLSQEAVNQWESDRERLELARSVRDGTNSNHQELQIKLNLLQKEINGSSNNLASARNTISDNALDEALKTAATAVATKIENVQVAEISLKAKNPERVRTLAETVRGSLKTAQKRRDAIQAELIEVQTRLKIHGEEGLHEKLQMAQTSLEHHMADNRSLVRRASSSRYLFETMREERDKVRLAYIAPLKDNIEHLGRLVFDDSFQVDISEDLQIVSRTMKNITIPFDYLSGGTKEQLSLIFRAACAVIVSKDDGVPLILDDTLGYTDPERLRLMGAVLATAAKECQIVIFTCVPDRYSNVGEASIIALG